MKKILLTLVMAITAMTVVFANEEEKVKSEVLRTFNIQFTGAKEVTWSIAGTHYKATFTYYGIHMAAWYETNGKFISVTRSMSSTELPLYLRYRLKTSFKDYWISDVVEESNKNGFTYYITLENSDQKIVLISKKGSTGKYIKNTTKLKQKTKTFN